MRNKTPLDCEIETEGCRIGSAVEKAWEVEPLGQDSRKPSACSETVPCRAEVSNSGLAIAAPLGAPGIGRVHEDDTGSHGSGQELLNELAVMAGNRRIGKQVPETLPAKRGDLVEREAATRFRCPDGEHARPCRGLEDKVAADRRSGTRREPCETRRRCELLQFDMLVTANGPARNKCFELVELQCRKRWTGAQVDLRPALQPDRLSELKRGMGVANGPAPSSVGSAELGGQFGAQDRS